MQEEDTASVNRHWGEGMRRVAIRWVGDRMLESEGGVLGWRREGQQGAERTEDYIKGKRTKCSQSLC